MPLLCLSHQTEERVLARACRCVARLPGEAEEDVDDGGCQIDTLLPVFPQDPGQRAQSCLCGRADKTLNAFIAHEKTQFKVATV